MGNKLNDPTKIVLIFISLIHNYMSSSSRFQTDIIEYIRILADFKNSDA